MLDPQLVRDNPDRVKKIISDRNMRSETETVDAWLQVDAERSQLIQQQQQINKERNDLAELAKDPNNREQARETGKKLKQRGKELDVKLDQVRARWDELLNRIPNVLMADVPIGATEEDNVVLKEVGDRPKFNFEPQSHLELGEQQGTIDFATGAKVSGSQFYYLKGDAVRLEIALLQYGIDFFTEKGYEIVITPDLAKSRFYLGTGFSPRGDEAQIYEIDGEDLGLIATAEVTMAGMFADEILEEKDLPLKFAAISHCFRKEAGAYGKYSKGLYRVHQFTKVEMFAYCTPDQSEQIHAEMLANEEELTSRLGIPYQVIEMCSGDLGAMAAKKYDLEAWMPGRGDYGEITSTSNCLDYQARNLNVRYKDAKSGQNEYVHMLNGTAIVGSRFPIAIMENYQQEDGSILVPEALQPYMGKKVMN